MSTSPVVELVKVGRDYRRGDEEVHALVDLSLTLATLHRKAGRLDEARPDPGPGRRVQVARHDRGQR